MASLEERFKETVGAYYALLTARGGAGGDAAGAVAQALEWAKRWLAGEYGFTQWCPAKQTLSVAELAAVAGAGEALTRAAGVFSSSADLGESFYARSADLSLAPDMDLDGLRTAFGALAAQAKWDDEIAPALNQALQVMVASNAFVPHPLRAAHQLQGFVVAFESPFFGEPESTTLTHGLMVGTASLPREMQDLLVAWWSRFELAALERLVVRTHQFISLRVSALGEEQYANDDALVRDASRFFSLLHRANERRVAGEARLTPEDFYNKAVNEMIDLESDYIGWMRNKQRKQQGGSSETYFCFCEHPFLLDASTKSHVVRIDAMTRMARIGMMAMSMTGSRASSFLIFRVRRDHLIEDMINQMAFYDPIDFKKQLHLIFDGEEGVDEGGVQKEFFQLMVAELFSPDFGMFVEDPDTRMVYFSPDSLENEDEFRLVGVVIGLAIYNGIICDIHFSSVVYKKLLGGTPDLQDLINLRPSVGNGLKSLLEFDGDVEEVFCRTFQISYEVFGEVKTVDLKPGGGDIALTKENRQEYVDLYVDYLLNKSVERQFAAFSEGFHRVAGDALQLFAPHELQLLVCGSQELDFVQLEEGCRYQDGFTKDSPQIRQFWEILHEFDTEQKKQFLAFTTGSSNVPIQGLASLRLTISRNAGDDEKRLPSAHTCFNHLLLPSYPSQDIMREKILAAIENCRGFGLM